MEIVGDKLYWEYAFSSEKYDIYNDKTNGT